VTSQQIGQPRRWTRSKQGQYAGEAAGPRAAGVSSIFGEQILGPRYGCCPRNSATKSLRVRGCSPGDHRRQPAGPAAQPSARLVQAWPPPASDPTRCPEASRNWWVSRSVKRKVCGADVGPARRRGRSLCRPLAADHARVARIALPHAGGAAPAAGVSCVEALPARPASWRSSMIRKSAITMLSKLPSETLLTDGRLV